MEMTKGEKLIAFMLADVMERIGEGEIDPAQVKRLLSGGDEWALQHIYPGLEEQPRSKAVVDETADILMMFRVLDGAIDNLTDEERAELNLDRLKFEGFDGNDPDGHKGAARVMTEQLEWFDERKPILNSHSGGSIIRYRRMLPRFNAAIEANPIGGLSLEQLKGISAP